MKQSCCTCAYYQPSRYGRYAFGKCTWRAPWPEAWPDSHKLHGGADRPLYPIVLPVRAIDGRNCETWRRRDEQE